MVPADFFLDTSTGAFRNATLAEGQFGSRGTRIVPDAINSPLLTEEGEADISGLGQTWVAHDLCWRVSAERRAHFLCPRVGHWGPIHGTTWRRDVLPRISQFIRQNG